MTRKEKTMKLIKQHKFIASLIVALILALSLILINYNANKTKENEMLKRYGLYGLTVEEMVVRLDTIITEPATFNASITGDKLKITEDGKTFEYNTPEDLFYLSFAPFINDTHQCTTHNLRTCRAELKNETFQVSFYDEDSKLIFTEEKTSMENGFVGMWLPKDSYGKLVVNYNGLEGESFISTSSNSNTCLTTIRLK